MNWANIGKKLVKAKELGKDLNKISLGKYEPTTKAKRDKLAKGVRKLRKGGNKETAKKFAKNPEQFRGPKTFLTHDEQKKMGTPGQYWLGPRTKKNPSDYKHGGSVGNTKRVTGDTKFIEREKRSKQVATPKRGGPARSAQRFQKRKPVPVGLLSGKGKARPRHNTGGRVAKRKK